MTTQDFDSSLANEINQYFNAIFYCTAELRFCKELVQLSCFLQPHLLDFLWKRHATLCLLDKLMAMPCQVSSIELEDQVLSHFNMPRILPHDIRVPNPTLLSCPENARTTPSWSLREPQYVTHFHLTTTCTIFQASAKSTTRITSRRLICPLPLRLPEFHDVRIKKNL